MITDIAALREASEIGETSDWMTWPKVDPTKLKHVLDHLEAAEARVVELTAELKETQEELAGWTECKHDGST